MKKMCKHFIVVVITLQNKGFFNYGEMMIKHPLVVITLQNKGFFNKLTCFLKSKTVVITLQNKGFFNGKAN